MNGKDKKIKYWEQVYLKQERSQILRRNIMLTEFNKNEINVFEFMIIIL